MASTGKKKGSSKAGSRSKTRKRRVAGDPITVGGGGGRKRKRVARIPDSFIKFNRGRYKKKGSHKYESDTDVLLGIDISCLEDAPATSSTSTIQIDFSDSRSPNTQERTSLTITGTPLGIEFTGDWVDKGPPRFHCSYLMVREIYVDDDLVVRSDDGDCTVIVYNKPVTRRAKR